MIDEILSFAKLDGGHEFVEPLSLDGRAIAREAADLIEVAATAKGLAFRLDIPDTPVRLVVDSAKTRMILVNLCGNAVKFTHTGEVCLSVQGVGDQVHFDVTDTGIGIAPEHHERIFHRFWQVDGTPTRTVGGLGIGLAAAREYALLLGGDVGLVKSGIGEGSTFRLWLPLVYAAP
jgi:signal transduction histidine kinase